MIIIKVFKFCVIEELLLIRFTNKHLSRTKQIVLLQTMIGNVVRKLQKCKKTFIM